MQSKKHDPNCPDCKGTGERDSGGVHPWGAPAMMPCDCCVPLHDLDWYAQACGVSVEQIRCDLGLPPDDAIRRNSLGCAALDDIISHSLNLQSAMNARIRMAVSEDREQVKAAGLSGEEFQGPTDSNESYWKRESKVLDRIVYQARFARGRTTS